MASNRVRDFLRTIQGIVQELETTLVDTLAAVAPWLGPIAPAYLAYQAMVNVLMLPVWVASVIAAVIELLGISTINTSVQFWNYNQTKRQSDPNAPFWLALVMAVFYLSVVLVVNVLLDDATVIHKTAKFLLSALSPVAAVTLSLRAQHSRRMLDVADVKRQEKEEREKRKLQKVSSKDSEGKVKRAKVTEEKPETFGKWKHWTKVPREERAKISGMSDVRQVEATYGVSERTAYNWMEGARAELVRDLESSNQLSVISDQSEGG
jgi:signal transduction histidine kinase